MMKSTHRITSTVMMTLIVLFTTLACRRAAEPEKKNLTAAPAVAPAPAPAPVATAQLRRPQLRSQRLRQSFPRPLPRLQPLRLLP